MRKALRLVGCVVLVGLVVWRLDWSGVAAAFSGFDGRFWALAALTYLVAQLVSSWRWQLVARPLGLDAPYRRFVELYLVGTFYNLLLPTSVGGDVVRAWGLGSGRRAAAFLTVLAERGSGLLVLVLLACLAGLVSPIALPSWMVLALVVLAAGLPLGAACLPLLGRFKKFAAVGEAVRVYVARPRLALVALGLSVVVQLLSVLQGWLIARGLGLSSTFGYLAIVIPLVALLTLAPISLNGMGLRELGLIVLLAPVGVTEAEAVAFSVLLTASSAAIGLLGGAALLFVQGGTNRANALGRGADQGRSGQSATAA